MFTARIGILRIRSVMLLMAVTACDDGTHNNQVSSQSAPPVITVASTTQIGRLNDTLGEGLSIGRAYAVRSASHRWAHFVAARVHGASGADSVGIWFFQDGMDIPGDGYAVNNYARSISSMQPFPDLEPVQIGTHPEVVALASFAAQRP